MLSRTLQGTSQLPVRLSMLLLAGLVVLADALGLDILLGAFAAGSLVGLAARGPGAEPFRQKLDALGFVPVANSPTEFSERIKSEAARWDKVVKAAGIHMD